MDNFIIYHNPKCSKSRQTLALMVVKGYDPEIFLYLKEKLSPGMLEEVLLKLNMKPRDLLRKGEDEYKENNLSDDTLSVRDLIDYMVKYPKLIERPIVIKENRAVLGRPPENVLKLFELIQGRP
jgi:arsenate reductase